MPTTLIVGTFNPEWPINNEAEWFYGRTNNNYFGDVLPRIYNEPSLSDGTPTDWKQFCNRNSIAITDLIACIQDARQDSRQHNQWLKNYGDNNIAANFNQFTFVNITHLLQQYPTITNIYLTRGLSEQFWADLWNPIQDFCQNTPNVRCRELLTPSGNARFQHGRYRNSHPTIEISLPNFIKMKWEEKWHEV